MPEVKKKNKIKINNKTIKIVVNKAFPITLTIIELFLVFVIVFLYYFSMPIYTKRVIFIPKGSTKHIITYLSKKYPVNYLDYLLLKSFGYPQSGWIDLKQTKMTKFVFLKKLTYSKAAMINMQLTPGETYYFFLKDLAKKLKISEKKLFFYYEKFKFKKDGNIISQTYKLPIGMDEKELILYLFKYTDNYYKKLSYKIFGEYDKINWYKFITIASIIQKEAANIEEMPLIASVIYNRLKKKMRLQMDGTLNYGPYSHTPITPERIKQDNSDYNTYKHYGIPSNPICAVEFNSIKAAIYPAKTPYLYFVKSVDGTKHYFTTSYKNHLRLIKRIKAKLRRLKKKKLKQRAKKLRKHLFKNHKRQKYKYKRVKKTKKDLKNLWKSVF